MWGHDRVQSLLAHKKLKTTLSSESANLLPIQGEWQGTQTPGMILGGRRGQLMSWYPFDNTAGNYNVVVVGRSGSGKSVFMQELMTTTLGLGGKVFVLDVGRSFEKTCFLLEGQFIEFKAKTPLCLNPFSTIPTHDPDVAQDALAMLKSILILMASPSQKMSDLEVALLEQAMLHSWQAFQNACTITHIADYLLQHADQKAKDLGTMLFPYTTEGIYGRFFNGPSTVNLDNNLVVLELEELKERKDLQAVVVQMMIINITNRMFLGDRKTPFQIFFDEAWDLLRGAQSGLFIETLARRLRKYYGSLVVGTQSINDLFASPAAQAAFDNSDWMCLLSQKPESIEQLKKLGRISLTPLMEAQLKSVKTKQGEYAEVMIYGTQGYAIGRLLLDPYSQLLYSTKAKDYAAVKHFIEQGLSVSEALERLLSQKKEVL
jgi:conjugal transfer ATP-binding protein TraC